MERFSPKEIIRRGLERVKGLVSPVTRRDLGVPPTLQQQLREAGMNSVDINRARPPLEDQLREKERDSRKK